MNNQDITFDQNNLKIKHLSDQYKILPSAPEPDDILYYCFVKKRKQISIDELKKFFGEDKLDVIKESLERLDFSNYLMKISDTEFKMK